MRAAVLTGKLGFWRAAAALLMMFALAACSTSEAMRVEPSAAPMPPRSASDPDKYAAYVMDATTGRALYAVNADAPRYPASLTKMMTLYLLFESMQSGRVTLTSAIPISANAARQPPSKLRLRAGDQIDVASAIQALTVKSANDVAVAVGEYLGDGSEERFAQIMTAKARQLGMRNTNFVNASGLPDPMQTTTARDMAILGNALRKKFPSRGPYFSQTSFNFRGQTIRGHNDLLGRVPGIDGMKTGYVRASGFNIVTSASSAGKNLMVVVMGGRSARARNDEVEALVNRFFGRSAASYAPRPDLAQPGIHPAYAQSTQPLVQPAPMTTAPADLEPVE